MVRGGPDKDETLEQNQTADSVDLDKLIQLQDYGDEEDCGPDLAQNVAKVISVMAKGKMSEDKIKEKMDKHKRPQNINITVPRVNNEIWNVMDHSAKSADLRTQKNAEITAENHLCLVKGVQSLCLKELTRNA